METSEITIDLLEQKTVWFTGEKDCCSQFFAGSVQYVSNATVHSSDGIKPFFY